MRPGYADLKLKMRSVDRRMFTLLMIVFVQMFGASMVHPILPLYAQSAFNMKAEVITLLLTAFFAAQFVAGPFIGGLSDRRGRLPVLIFSQLGTVIAFLMIGFAQSAVVLFLARILDGITGGNIVVAQAYVTDIVPEDRRTVALGYVMAAFGLGFAVGPAVGGILASAFGPQIPFVFAAIAAAGTVVLTHFTLEESLSHDDRQRNRKNDAPRLRPMALMRNVPLVAVLSVSFFARFGMGLLIATLALFAEAVLFSGQSFSSVSLGVGVMLMMVGIGQIITQVILLPAALNYFSDTLIVLMGAAARALSMFLLALAVEPLFGTASVVIFAVGSGLLIPPLQSLLTKTVPVELRGAIFGVYQSVMSLAVILSTAIAGLLFAADPTIPNWVGGALSCISLVPGLLLWKWARRNGRMPAAQLAG
ncbi:MAG: MFS transporter [Chloroflexota bacterium]|nr:MFS transporter [Chloroflexota bacterium]